MFLWEVNGFRMEQKSKGDLFFVFGSTPTPSKPPTSHLPLPGDKASTCQLKERRVGEMKLKWIFTLWRMTEGRKVMVSLIFFF
jgi:hypothetical protein